MNWLKWYISPTKFIRTFQIELLVFCMTIWTGLIMLYPSAIWEFSAGLIPPLVMTLWSTGRMVKRFTTAPETLTGFMIKAFGFKLVFYAFIFIIILGFSPFNSLKFVLSFLGFFSSLHAIEAVYLHQLLKESQNTK